MITAVIWMRNGTRRVIDRDLLLPRAAPYVKVPVATDAGFAADVYALIDVRGPIDAQVATYRWVRRDPPPPPPQPPNRRFCLHDVEEGCRVCRVAAEVILILRFLNPFSWGLPR